MATASISPLSLQAPHRQHVDGQQDADSAALQRTPQASLIRSQRTDFAHSQNQKVAIQLAHSGGERSTVAPWLNMKAVATSLVDGWADRLVGPSVLASDEASPLPKALTVEVAIPSVIKAEFLSPLSNKSIDAYGGSHENRIRLLLEVVDAVRGAIPKDMPLLDVLVHIKSRGGTGGLDSGRCSAVAKILSENDVDLVDVSSGGVIPITMKKVFGPQSDLSAHSKTLLEKGTPCFSVQLALVKPLPLPESVSDDTPFTGAVGGVTTGTAAEEHF
ncbi:FMN-linked oxidoreductase [Fistulina hepatica ATCC 64428]|uniref:FMN-linked oxidoreductase n=1 Tax=Fistulina hepatica ATCC 64428 TaxID=1128425 RepID=A0A0D7A6P7_9AGAR|nr:FMN-linked oxidoreductase [Fistulina hepatica ATCC 64428]